MHVQIVSFELNGITEEQYWESCRGETDTFAGLPGLLGKVWLRDADADVYGGLYLWRDRDSCERYVKGEIFRSIADDPTLKNVSSRDFGVFEDLTKETQPAIELLPAADAPTT
jgi:hypothetical protein